MLLEAARDYDIDLGASWMIGDSKADVEAGHKAGCRTVLLGIGNGSEKEEPDLVAPSLLEAVQQLLKREEAVANV